MRPVLLLWVCLKNIVLHLKILFQWLRFCQISHIFNLHVNFPIDRKLDKSIRSNDILPHVYLIKMSVSKKSVASCLSCRLVTYLIGIFNDYMYQITYERCNPRDKHRGQREKISPISVKGIRCLRHGRNYVYWSCSMFFFNLAFNSTYYFKVKTSVLL